MKITNKTKESQLKRTNGNRLRKEYCQLPDTSSYEDFYLSLSRTIINNIINTTQKERELWTKDSLSNISNNWD